MARRPRRPILLDAGADTVAAFQTAKGYAVTLDACRSIRDAYACQRVRAPGNHTFEQATRYAAIADPVTAEVVVDTLTKRGGLLGVWPELLATPGVTGLKWPTIDEQTAEVTRLTDMVPTTTDTGGWDRQTVVKL